MGIKRMTYGNAGHGSGEIKCLAIGARQRHHCIKLELIRRKFDYLVDAFALGGGLDHTGDGANSSSRGWDGFGCGGRHDEDLNEGTEVKGEILVSG